MKKLLLMIMILSTSGYIISEPKQLFCKWVDEGLSKEAIEKAPLRYKENKKGEEITIIGRK